jgi:peptidyl-prolyl cis-trans isomerase SurA
MLEKMLKSILFIGLVSYLALVCSAQSSFVELEEGQSLDKIVAAVGGQVILASEVDAQMYRTIQNNQSVSFADEEIRLDILNQLIDDKLVVVKAIEDSMEVGSEEIDARWQQLLEQWVGQYGSEERIEKIFKKPISRIKFDYSDQIRNQILSQRLSYTKFGQISVTPKEVERFYQEYKDSLQIIPDQYDLAHIMLEVSADESSKKESFEKAKSIRDSLLNGTDFAELAKRNSQDPGSAPSGGELGWFERGKLFPEFEKEAFALSKGETSLPVETPFGYHIIQTMDKKKNSILTRHILIKFGETEDKQQETINKLLEIKARVEAGEDFESLAKELSQDKDSKAFGGALGKMMTGRMPNSTFMAVKDLKDGQITDPFPHEGTSSKPAYHIILRKKFYPSHKMSLEEDSAQIENFAKMNKQSKLMKKWVAELRKELYWEIF